MRNVIWPFYSRPEGKRVKVKRVVEILVGVDRRAIMKGRPTWLAPGGS
jgi:hypothetical protein